jgi:hypothetical protein
MPATAVFRFMSVGELAAFERGERVCSPYYGGSYFLPLFGEWGPTDAFEFLVGVANTDVCAVFVAPSMVFEDRLAPYANPAYCSAWDDTIDVRELFAPGGYARDDGFVLVGVLRAPEYDRSPEGRRILHDAWVLQHAA